MTAEQLIKRLEQFPSHLPVIISLGAAECCALPVEDVYMDL